ncbi:Molybdopterin synthase catalytic subunit [Chamberlinius hualienensis]
MSEINCAKNGHNFWTGLTFGLLDERDYLNFLKSDEYGGVALFVGTTRNHHEGRKVLRLEYEAFEEMAEKQLCALAAEIKSKWPEIGRLVLRHRLGEVGLRQASVVVGASSAHRKDSLEAVSYGIDQIKSQIAIWKKEVYEDGENEWQVNKECLWTAAAAKKTTNV